MNKWLGDNVESWDPVYICNAHVSCPTWDWGQVIINQCLRSYSSVANYLGYNLTGCRGICKFVIIISCCGDRLNIILRVLEYLHMICWWWCINFWFHVQLPTQDQLKTVVDKVKDFFGDAKESFGKITTLNSSEEAEETSESKWVHVIGSRGTWLISSWCIALHWFEVKLQNRRY